MEEIKIKDFFSDSKAFFIAVSKYTPPVSPLQSPGKDVDRLKNILIKHHNFNTPDVTHKNRDGSTHVFSNPLIDPTKDQLLNFLSSIKANDNDRVLLYFACHGIAIDSEDNPKGYILPASAVPGVWESFIEMKEIFDLINSLSCKHLLIVLDCCYAGAFRWASQTRSLGSEVPKTIYQERFEQFTKNKSCQVLTSSAHDQTAIDTLRLGKREDGDSLSPFASLLVEALEQGSADAGFGNVNPDGIITISEISLFLQEKIFNLLHEKGIDADNRQLPTLFPIVDSKRKLVGKGEFVFLNPTMATITLKQKKNSNPYKGLSSYSIKESNLFYGRERVLKGWYENNHFNIGLIDASKSFNIVVITGPSGIGKSSLAKAGLLAYYDGENKIIHEIRPGKTPYNSHQNLIAELKTAEEMQIVLIDQYEELITVCDDEEEKNKFENALAGLGDKHSIIITIRSDFENQFKDSSLLMIHDESDQLKKYRFIVPPFSREEVQEVVVQPAIQEVLEFKAANNKTNGSEKFINRIVDEAFQNPGSIPLLSLALSTLYTEKEGNNLLESKYKGVLGILDDKATRVYTQYATDPLKESLFRNLIYRTISLEGGQISKRRVYYEKELNFNERSKTEIINEIRKTLENERLFNADVDESGIKYTEPSHDAFLRNWPLLTKWLQAKYPDMQRNSGQDKVLLLKSVSDIALTYSNETEKTKKKKYLWIDDPRLDETRKQIPDSLNAIETAFINDSYNERKRKRKIWWTTAIITSTLIILFGIVAWIQANKSAQEARRNKALYLVSESDKYLPSDAIRLLEAAYQLYPENVEIFRKFNELMEYTTDIHLFPVRNLKHNSAVKQVVFSEADSLIISICESEFVARLWTLTGNMKELKPPDSAIAESIAFIKPTGWIVLLSSKNQNSRLTFWDKKGNYIRQYSFNFYFRRLGFSSDGKNLLAIQTKSYTKDSVVIFDISRIQQTIKFQKIEGANFYPSPVADSFQVKVPISRSDSVEVSSYSYKNVLNYSKYNLVEKDIEGSQAGKIEVGDKRFVLDRTNGKTIYDLGTGVLRTVFSTNGFLYILKKDSILRYQENTNKILVYNTGRPGKNFFPLGNYIVQDESDISEARKNKIKIFTNGRRTQRLQYDGKFIYSFGKDGKQAISVDDNYIRLWNLGSNEVREIAYLGSGIRNNALYEAEFVDSNNNVVGKSEDHDIKRYDFYDSTSKLIESYECVGEKAINNSLFYCIYEDGAVLSNIVRNGQVVPVNDFNFDSSVSDFCFTPDGIFLIGLHNNCIFRVNVETEESDKICIQNEIDAIYPASESNAVIALQDSTILLLKFNGKQDTLHIPARFNSENFKVSDDGKYIIAWVGKEICFLDTRSKKYTTQNMPADITDAFFSPGSSKVVIATEEVESYVYSIERKQLKNIYKDMINRKSEVQSASFTKDGQRFIIELDDKVILFNSEGSEIAVYDDLKKPSKSAKISQDGSRIMFLTNEGNLKYIYTPEKILNWLKTAPIAPLSDELKRKYEL